MEADPILPNLFMGGHSQDRGPLGTHPPFDLRVLAARELSRDDGKLAVRSVAVGLDDSGHPLTTHEALRVREVAHKVAFLVAKGHRVLVTCAMGRNRSGLVVARALMFLGYEPRKAINAVRARRRQIADVPALENEAFRSWLIGGG